MGHVKSVLTDKVLPCSFGFAVVLDTRHWSRWVFKAINWVKSLLEQTGQTKCRSFGSDASCLFSQSSICLSSSRTIDVVGSSQMLVVFRLISSLASPVFFGIRDSSSAFLKTSDGADVSSILVLFWYSPSSFSCRYSAFSRRGVSLTEFVFDLVKNLLMVDCLFPQILSSLDKQTPKINQTITGT